MPVKMPTDRTDQLFTKAIEHHRAGHLADAQTLYREILAIDDRHAEALHHLGVAAHQVGNHDRAAELIGRAIAIDESVAEFHYNIGLVFRSLGRLEEAVRHNERAIALSPDWAQAHHILGSVLAAAGRHAAAVEQYQQALALDPEMADTHFELGNALLALGQCEQAASAYNQTLLRRPEYAQAHNNLGSALLRIGRVEEGAAHYRRALSLKPDLIEGLNNLASALIIQGRAEQALPLVRQGLLLREDDTAKLLFTQWIGAAQSFPTDTDFRRLLIRAISEGWDRPTSFLPAALAILKHEGSTAECIRRATESWPHLPPAADLFGSAGLSPVANDQLLSCLLQTGANIDIDIERFLTAARRALLEAATVDPSAPTDDDTLRFYSRLAAQCFINEYVFIQSQEEVDRVLELRGSVDAALKTGAPIPPIWPVALAAYTPLESLSGEQLLLNRAWPSPVADLLAQQITEPAEERSYRSEIPRLTRIDDDVSIKVQRQYEENPYPRWLKVARYAPISVNAHIRGMFPAARFQPLPETDDVEILVAGCGTGRHAIERAQLISGARVLAVDLSLDSLCYAMRMTRQFGIDNIEYAQADLLELGSLSRTFDVVEAGGVLHHLADPLAGWRALLAVLRPGGFMFLGFYSRIGRADITAGRAFVAERGFAPTAEDIRRCRQDILEEADPNLARIIRTSDFFTMSECRDLLFHVQEHCLTLPQIKNFLAEHELDFLGFNERPEVRGRYSRMFPDDPSMTNLDNWHLFETEHPDTFLGMYEFWVQKRH